ncbi:hypothetical protein D3C77_279590 [compost metagenome]|jgi:hypothetical protein
MDSLEGFKEGSATVIDNSTWEIKIKNLDAIHKRWEKTIVILSMTILVGVMNISVINLISHVSGQEMELVGKKIMDASNRTIDSKVYMALIAGTVAEVSALFLIILKSLFKDA